MKYLFLILLMFVPLGAEARLGDRILFGPIDEVGRVEANRGDYVCVCGGVDQPHKKLLISSESREGRNGHLQEGKWYGFRIQEGVVVAWSPKRNRGNLGAVELDEDCQPESTTPPRAGAESIGGDALEAILSRLIREFCPKGDPCIGLAPAGIASFEASTFEGLQEDLARDELEKLLAHIKRSKGKDGHHGKTGNLERFFDLEDDPS